MAGEIHYCHPLVLQPALVSALRCGIKNHEANNSEAFIDLLRRGCLTIGFD